MRNKELTAALAALQRVLADPRLEPAHREKLRKGKRELEKIRRSGKLDHNKVFRAVSLLSSTLVERLADTEYPKTPAGTELQRNEHR